MKWGLPCALLAFLRRAAETCLQEMTLGAADGRLWPTAETSENIEYFSLLGSSGNLGHSRHLCMTLTMTPSEFDEALRVMKIISGEIESQ